MSEADYENLKKMYGWDNTNPVLYIIEILMLIIIFLILPYIYVRFIEERLVVLFQKIKLKLRIFWIGMVKGKN